MSFDKYYADASTILVPVTSKRRSKDFKSNAGLGIEAPNHDSVIARMWLDEDAVKFFSSSILFRIDLVLNVATLTFCCQTFGQRQELLLTRAWTSWNAIAKGEVGFQVLITFPNELLTLVLSSNSLALDQSSMLIVPTRVLALANSSWAFVIIGFHSLPGNFVQFVDLVKILHLCEWCVILTILGR